MPTRFSPGCTVWPAANAGPAERTTTPTTASKPLAAAVQSEWARVWAMDPPGHPRRPALTLDHDCRSRASTPVVEVQGEAEGHRTLNSRRRPSISGRWLCGAAALGPALGLQALETGILRADVAHRGGDRPVAGLLGDLAVHVQGDAPVRRVPLRRRTELQQVHGLSGVELHGVADPVGHADGVGGLLRERLDEG